MSALRLSELTISTHRRHSQTWIRDREADPGARALGSGTIFMREVFESADIIIFLVSPASVAPGSQAPAALGKR